MKKIVCIVGTRPQLIKHSILVRQLKQSFRVETLNTRQHHQYELNELLKEDLLEYEPLHQLDLPDNLTPAVRLGEMINKIASFLHQSKPDAVLVYGDTDSTLAGALAANKSKFCLIHVEAGERSGNMEMPEEHNRIVTDSLSNILFCSSYSAINTLKRECVSKHIVYSGDVMKDLVLQKASSFLQRPIKNEYIYCTIHRNYNQNNPQKLQEILGELQKLNTTIIFPVHPGTLKTIQGFCGDISLYSNIQFLPPLSYSQSIHYQKFAKAVITDSGGIQKEAYWMNRPCITLRKETEWIDTLKGNWNQLLYDVSNQLRYFLHQQPDEDLYDPEMYGTGNACLIVQQNLVALLN